MLNLLVNLGATYKVDNYTGVTGKYKMLTVNMYLSENMNWYYKYSNFNRVAK